jgi:hypothetical protein
LLVAASQEGTSAVICSVGALLRTITKQDAKKERMRSEQQKGKSETVDPEEREELSGINKDPTGAQTEQSRKMDR